MNPFPYTEIEPVIKNLTIQYVQVLVEQVELNKGAYCFVVLYNNEHEPIERKRMFITGVDYDRWIQDDDIIDVVLEKLNLQRKGSSLEGNKVEDTIEDKKEEENKLEEEQEIENEEENKEEDFMDEEAEMEDIVEEIKLDEDQ